MADVDEPEVSGHYAILFFTAERYTRRVNKTAIKHFVLYVGVGLMLVSALVLLFEVQNPSGSMQQYGRPVNAVYLDASRSVEERTEDLLSRMTLAEKVGQMVLVERSSIKEMSDLSSYALGALLSGAGSNPEDNSLHGWATMVAGFQEEVERRSRLGIPILYGVDAVHGHGNVPGATVFPHAIGLGAANEPDLTRRSARATGEELEATGVYWSFSPNLDLPKDIRWGRVYETFSDDPALVALHGRAYIEGLQQRENDSTASLAVLATPKHYVGLGSMLWGTSRNAEYRIDQGTTPADEMRLRAEYLPPFQEALKGGAQSIMVGLNRWGDKELASSHYLLQDVLKDELGFTGFLVSDWYGVYEIPGSDYRSAITAINAGVDMVMLPFDYVPFVANVTQAVTHGAIPIERIDDAVRRILRVKFALGLFERNQRVIAEASFGSAEHRAIAREAVGKSLVLLKNDQNVLPLGPETQHIRVAGSAADNVGRQTGAWTVAWQGIEGNWLPGATSILQGIRAGAPTGTLVEFSATGTFASHEDIADVGIAIVGEAPYSEGYGDSPLPTLTDEDTAAINALRLNSKKVVVILVSGRPLLISHHLPTWDALVMAWLPGSEGAGIADVLFGSVPFTGRLPIPWPASLSQLPVGLGSETNDGSPLQYERFFGIVTSLNNSTSD